MPIGHGWVGGAAGKKLEPDRGVRTGMGGEVRVADVKKTRL